MRASFLALATGMCVLTGDGDPGDFSGHVTGSVSSIGIIKSTDSGNSWYPTGFSFSYPSMITPTALLINPHSADTQFVATKSGLYKTVNNWMSYTTMIPGEIIYDVEYHPANTQIMYCSGRNWIRRSTSHGILWLPVTDSDFIGWNAGLRVQLAVTPHLPSVVYALVGDTASSPTVGIYKSLLDGMNNSWTIQDTSTELLDGQVWYNMSMAVKNTDHKDVFVGGVWARRSYTSGLTWDTINNLTIHADVHDIQYRNGKLYMATDGGFHRSTDDGNTWTNLWSGLSITEIYRISGTPQDAALYYCGSQDNGIMKRQGSSTFTLAISGDGMVTQVNYMNSDTVFGCVQNGDCHRSVDGYLSWDVMDIPSGPGEWVAPMIMDPVIPSVIFVARDSIYRSNSSGSDSSWVFLGQPLPASANCLKQGTNNRNRLYASRESQIRRTDNALTNSGPATWINVTPGLPDLFITDIAVDPSDANKVYVSLSGYTDGQKVFRSTSGGSGASWTNITGSLPNIPINCIEFHSNGNNSLYVGTDIGVFYRDDNLGDWIYYSNNLPTVVVNDLYINTTSNKVVAGTYGRGMWESVLYAGCNQDLMLLDFGTQVGGTRFYSATHSIQSVQRHKPDLGTEVHYNAGSHIDLKLGFEIKGLAFFEGKIGPCPPSYNAPMLSPELQNRPFILSDEFLATLMRSD